MRLLFSDLKAFEPVCVGSVFGKVPIVVWRTITPPGGAAFSQSELHRVDAMSSLRLGVLAASRISQCAPRRHQFIYQAFALFFGQREIACAPETTLATKYCPSVVVG